MEESKLVLTGLPSLQLPICTSVKKCISPTSFNNCVFQADGSRLLKKTMSVESLEADGNSQSSKSGSIGGEERVFREAVLQKLEHIFVKLEAIEERLKCVEDSCSATRDDDRDECRDVFPLQTHTDVDKIELLLRESSYCDKIFLSLNKVRGREPEKIVANLLKSIFVDTLSAQFSWLGGKGKNVFKALGLAKIIMRVVRFHFPSTSETEIAAFIAMVLDSQARTVIQELDVEGLSKWLRDQKVDDNTIAYLREQEMCGCAFLQLSDADIRGMNLKLGPTKLLARAVRLAIVQADGDQQQQEKVAAVASSNAGPSHTTTVAAPSAKQTSCLSERIHGSFSKYATVREILLQHPQGKELIIAAEKGGELFKVSHRRALVRVLVSELVRHYDSHYPPDEAKKELAAQLVKEFPKLKDTTDVTQEGYHHFYSGVSRSGFIEYRLWTLRRSLPPSQKKYKTTGCINITASTVRDVSNSNINTGELLCSEDLEEKKIWMKVTLPTEANRKDISDALRCTLPNRRHWILSDHPSVSTIFEEYPRLADYNGEMIVQEFQQLQDAAASRFLLEFEAFYVPRLLKMALVERPDIVRKLARTGIHDDGLKALLVLCELMPPANFKMKGKKARMDDDWGSENDIFPHPDLIVMLKEKSDVDVRVYERLRSNGESIPPFLLCLAREDGAHYCVMANSSTMCMGPEDSVLKAFDVLFKLHYVCNVTFSNTLASFYNFIECFVYHIPNCKPKNFNTSLNVTLTHIEL